jgi:hypothetical protein
MREFGDRARSGVSGAGLCNSCLQQRVITSGRGSAFSLCRLSAFDERFARYPRLPVLACDGYEAGSPDEGGSSSDSSPSNSPSTMS